MPQEGRRKVLANALRIATKKVIFVDIHPAYEPSRQMLSGEPYFMDYKKYVDVDFKDASKRVELVENKVVMWEFDAQPN